MDSTINSRNGFSLQNKTTLPDGTIEITDNLPKQDYYKSLRHTSKSAPGSQFTVNNSTAVYDATIGLRKSKPIDFKPSGKQVQCSVIMLEGVEEPFIIDRNSFGIHIFRAICDKLDLKETEYFGLTYRGGQHVDMWLRLDERISKQLDSNPWKFEFRFKFYPARPEDLKDDLTRYFLCLQVRQDIFCGQLPCSFNTYVILGAYAIQSDAGDWDPVTHEGTEYLFKEPFPPPEIQTPEMLIRIAEMHQKLKGRTPEQADRVFLDNARRMALYGVHLHRVKAPSGEDLTLGINHSGVMVYRGRLRMQRFTWARIVELSYRGKDFIMVVRPVLFDEYLDNGTTVRSGHGRMSRASSTTGRASPPSGTLQRSKSMKPLTKQGQWAKTKPLAFRCLNGELAKRLYSIVVDHHVFFRLREDGGSRRLNLQSGFSTRKYHYNSRTQIFGDDDSLGAGWTLGRNASISRPQQVQQASTTGTIKRVGAQRKPEQYAKSLVTLMTPVASKKGANFRAPCASIEDAESLRNGSATARTTFLGARASSVLMEEQYAPYDVVHSREASLNAAPPLVIAATAESVAAGPIVEEATEPQHHQPEQSEVRTPDKGSATLKRPPLSKEHWQMSPADCTQGLGMDFSGTDVATMMDAGWQGSRANRGVRGVGCFYYEVVVLEDGYVRVGWSTNKASLMLGMDPLGHGYGADENGNGSHLKSSTMGRLVHNSEAHEMGFSAAISDIIGCFLQLQNNQLDGSLEGNVMWSHNGHLVVSPNANLVRITSDVANNNSFFPAVSLMDARVSINFGDRPFIHQPGQITGNHVSWTAPLNVPDTQLVRNTNAGWRINQFDTSSTNNLEVSEDGRMIQTRNSDEWQGFRANKGVFEAGRYYYEIEKVEDTGFARFGWSLSEANFQLGTDNRGYGFGSGPYGAPRKKLFNSEVEQYGVVVRVGDVVGCFLDLDNGVIHWSVNGEEFDPAYNMDSSFISHPRTVFYPAAALLNTTLEVNYGDRPFKYQPTEEWYPLFAATNQYVHDSPKWPRDINSVMKPQAVTDRVESDIHRPDILIEMSARKTDVLHSEPPCPVPPIRTESLHSRSNSRPSDERDRYDNDEGEDTVIRTASDDEITPSTEGPFISSSQFHQSDSIQVRVMQTYETANEDDALTQAIHDTTKLDEHEFVVNGSTDLRQYSLRPTDRAAQTCKVYSFDVERNL